MRYATSLAAALLFVVPVSAEPFHHPYGEWREYNRDWLSACPDAIDEDAADIYGFSCFASTGSQLQNGSSLPAYKLTLFQNRLNGELDLAVTVATDDGEYDQSAPMRLVFSGAPAVELRVGKNLETRYSTINQFFVSDPALKADLIDSMKQRNAVTLEVPMTSSETPASIWFSLRGVTASLDFMSTYARKVAQY